MQHTEGPSDRIDPRTLPPASTLAPRRIRLEPEERARFLEESLAILEDLLAQQPDAGQALESHRILRGRAVVIRSDRRTAAAAADYAAFLRQLGTLFAAGCGQRENLAFAYAAPAYAALVEALSWARPGLDYTTALGQLLELMTQLFAARQPLWKLVYRHLRSIPGSVAAKQTLKRVCSADIREWYDAGVQNLFSLRNDLDGRILGLTTGVADLTAEIEAKTGDLAALRDASRGQNVVLLEAKIREREIKALLERREEILAEREGKTDTLALIESDIQEFESLLREARRAYYLRLA
jgi:hypothetical protein